MRRRPAPGRRRPSLPAGQPDRIAPETPGIVVGNTTPKYTSRNPAIRWLTERWVASLEAIFERVAERPAESPTESPAESPADSPTRALEVGCGEGVIAGRLGRRWSQVVALDLPDADLRRQWRGCRGPRFLHADAHARPFEDRQFDLVVAVEVLEHLHDPLTGLQELARVGSRHLVLSVPREPVFRSCNLLTGRYLGDLGNTPGHLNHWSRRGFVRLVSSVATVMEVASPFPWTIVWAVLPDRPSRPTRRFAARPDRPGARSP